ncbi:ArsR/SmtB family transcription factor [Streptomyces sp. NPDC050504]|uniref:ArsR/SmtB family transcription factor n=1 Tax=Streptomyces sp. NPDC050504 TaxID=3365618 RepID=UPI0037B99039
MDLEDRVADLERRLAALEGAGPGPRAGDGDFWALEGLKEQFARLGVADGGVTYTGAVRLPGTGERYEWQYGETTDDLLDTDWSRAADAFAALGNAVRLRLLREVLSGRRTAAELGELDGFGTSGQIYHHLRQLTAAGWLHAEGRGKYTVPAGRVVPLLVMLSAARPA